MSFIKNISKKAGKELGVQLSRASKAIDDLLTPKQLAAKQKEQSRRTRRKLKEKEDPLKSFAGSKDPAIKRARQEAIDKARAQAKKTRGAQKRRQQKERKEAIDKRKDIIKKGAIGTGGTAAVIGLTALGSDDKPKPKPKPKRVETTQQMKKDKQAVSDIAKFSAKKNQEKKDKEKRRKEDAAKDLSWKDFSGKGALRRAKKAGLDYYMGADGKKKAAIDKSEIREGETMTEAFNRILGKKPRKKNMGGMMKSKMSSKGGAKGGKMARGMKGGGMMKSKMSSKGGKMGGKMASGYKYGGMAKQGANDRLDESLGMRRGKESTKSQSMKSRRDESRGARKKSTPQSAGVAKRGWGAVMK